MPPLGTRNDSPGETPEVPQIHVNTGEECSGSGTDSTREEARESRPHPEEPRFRLLAREVESFPCVIGKEFQAFHRISRGGALHRKGERNTRVVPPFPESPRCLSPLFSLHCLDFQAEVRLTPRCHVGQPCGKASWESLVGKPQIP